MFNDTPGVEVLSFTPAFSKQKCSPWISLIICIATLAAICFAPAYANDMVNFFGMWSLWAWMGLVALGVLLGALLSPMPCEDTYLVKAANKEQLSGFSEQFDIKSLRTPNTYRLTRKE